MLTGFAGRSKGRQKFAAIFTDLSTLTAGIFDSKSGARAATIWSNAGAPSNGTSGTFAGYALPGDLLVNTTTAALYQNTNTQASPTWSAAPVTGAAGITSGTINGATIGASTPSTGAFTYVGGSVATGLAAVGTNQGTALALTAQKNIVATAASAAVGVALPASAGVPVGASVFVYNDGPSNTFHVYGNGSDTIDGTAGSTGKVLTNAYFCEYLLTAAATWVSYRQAITRSA